MKIKPIVLVLLVFVYHSVTSQITQTTLVFKDGRKVVGYGKLQGKKVKFVSKQQKKPVVYPLKDLKEIQIESYETGEIETFIYVKVGRKSKPKILKQLFKDKISLYTDGRLKLNAGISLIHSAAGSPVDVSRSVNYYYAKRKGESEVVYLGSDRENPFSEEAVKRVEEFFKDCPELLEKFHLRKFRKNRIQKMVRFYNSNCQ